MKVKYQYSIPVAGAIISGCMEIDESEIEGMSEEEKENYISDMVWEDIIQNIAWGWEIEE